MEKDLHGWTLKELAELLGGELRGDPSLRVERAVPAGTDDLRGVTFAESEKFLTLSLSKPIGAVLVKRGTGAQSRPTIEVDSPRSAFGFLLSRLVRPLPVEPGIHPSAVVSPEASVDQTASVGAYAVVEQGASVGPRCRIYAFAYIGDGCRVGADSAVYPHAVLYQDVRIGERCVVNAGAVIGADGFGFVWDGKKQAKVPQVGGVVIGDDVEIGANACIDRATCGETVVSDGTKIDNLVQIGHNVSVGEDTVIAAQVGVSGSSRVGSRVTMGGQVAVSDHVAIGDDVVLGGRSGAFQDVVEPGQYFGLPPVSVISAMRLMALQQRLPEIFGRIKKLEVEIEELRGDE
ncbi:MAG TPA: UDP-3-O-(3-hydroxymyristoyl)glucosamine N-acyltransferase [Fimbriimonadaceae bacterium]|nr:UDP-3-O-(3-hydroxymyristoyl)glucosamine N-acyltransferase [Fimbriimonadaceae bacterium]